ncbi:MAG: hypothetical protein ACON44_02405 [Candidatus Puniceispirillaceae bacterium]
MRHFIISLGVLFIVNPAISLAQEIEVPALADVVSSLDASEISQMEASIDDIGSLSFDVDVAIDSAVSDAIAEGLISAEEATDASASLSIIADNQQFFDFDIVDVLGEVIESGEFDIAQIRETLEGFNSLPDADKAIVGQESFDTYGGYYTYACDPNCTQQQINDRVPDAKTQFDSLSTTGRDIVLNNMPLLVDNDG